MLVPRSGALTGVQSFVKIFHVGAILMIQNDLSNSIDSAVFTDRAYKQYIAVAPFPSRLHSPEIGIKCQRPFPACLQIWSLSENLPVDGGSKFEGPYNIKEQGSGDFGHMMCEMILCIEAGPAHEIKWCPLPSNDSVR